MTGIKIFNCIWPTCQVPLGFDLFSPEIENKSPLFSQKITPKPFLNVEETQKFATEKKCCWPMNLPLLYMQGTADNMIDPILNK